ncbi:E1-E2 ATPase-domain-containing protein [Usnea florida]
MSPLSSTASLDSRIEDDLSLANHFSLDAGVFEKGQTTLNSSLSISSPSKPSPELSKSNERFEAVLSIGGMTCASCTSAVDRGLSSNELPFVESVNVTLMTNSARVVFHGEGNLQKIVDTVEDLGYDTAVEHCDLISARSMDRRLQVKRTVRTVMLKIDGMFCTHCPPRILEAIQITHSGTITIEKPPTLKDPVMTVRYSPSPPIMSIRHIIATVKSIDKSFSAEIYTPPSIEQRSQAMQHHEQLRLFIRLLFSFVVAIPTLLIGVVWMSLVPASNDIRRFFEQTQWAGAVTRADWAMFILATPVFFLAADVFHVRAIKEIRALWRKGSKVPVFQRFYRFGSMNLLVSAGTSIAYFASIAVLGVNATTKSKSSGGNSTYFDSVVFLTFFILIGRFLEAYSKAKTGNAVGLLGNLRPREAVLITESVPVETASEDSLEEQKAPASQTNTEHIHANLLEVGDVVMVQHGSSPPADGTILDGSTSFNESSLTGEARAIAKTKGDSVFTGAINIGDAIKVSVTDVDGSSMLDQIVAVVREGQTKRAPVERMVDIVTGYFVPVITALAITTFMVWLALGESGVLSRSYLGQQQGGWGFWSLEFAIAVFVVACPCGIGLAAPTALFVGNGLAASHGILVRGGGEAFQEASNIDAVVFDKTGTLTEGGDLKVTDHEMLYEHREARIAWAVTKALEETSSHPLARAILAIASTQSSDAINTINGITEEPGRGMRGTFLSSNSPEDLDSRLYEAALGSESFISSLISETSSPNYFTKSVLSRWKSESKSVALLAMRRIRGAADAVDVDILSDNQTPWTLAAVFAISDPVRASAAPTISALQSKGIFVYMLTGDNPTTASAVASTLSIPQDHVFAGVLPTEKADKIRWLQENGPRRPSSSTWLKKYFSKQGSSERQKAKAIVAFIGDGINDAPALTTADVSISLSSASDIAMHSSSFILLSSSLDSIITLFDLSARVFMRVKLNFGWAVIYNIILVPVAAGVFFKVRSDGWRLGPVWGSAAMALSSLCVVVSSLALRWEGSWGELVGRGKVKGVASE